AAGLLALHHGRGSHGGPGLALENPLADRQRGPAGERVTAIEDAHPARLQERLPLAAEASALTCGFVGNRSPVLDPAQVLAAARGLRFGRWIARPRAARPASLIASARVGCGAMPSATVSTVDSASIATTPASTRSVTCGPTMTRPSSSPYRVSWIDFTQPTV